MVVALAIVAAIGDVGRFEQSQKLVSYLGLNPECAPIGSWARVSRPGSRSSGLVGMRAACSSRRLWAAAARERRVRCSAPSSCESSASPRGQHVANALSLDRLQARVVLHLAFA